MRFHLDSLCEQTNAREILDTLDNLKNCSTAIVEQLHVVYGRALKSIRDELTHKERALGLKVLRFLVRAGRTLTVKELQIAVSVTPNCFMLDQLAISPVGTLIDVCAGLVTVDGETIRLAHYTTQEYLKKELDTSTTDSDLAAVCITYLSFNTLAQGACTTLEAMEERLLSHSFLDYAACQLGSHL